SCERKSGMPLSHETPAPPKNTALCACSNNSFSRCSILLSAFPVRGQRGRRPLLRQGTHAPDARRPGNACSFAPIRGARRSAAPCSGRKAASFCAPTFFINLLKTVYHNTKGACQAMAAIQDITRELVFSLLPPRAPESHKGNYGKVLAVCGCAEY